MRWKNELGNECIKYLNRTERIIIDNIYRIKLREKIMNANDTVERALGLKLLHIRFFPFFLKATQQWTPQTLQNWILI